MAAEENNTPNVNNPKNYAIAVAIIVFSAFIIIVMVLHTLTCSSCDNDKLYTAILPLLASWVGTVLAFYFTKENFESANNNVKKLVDQVTTSAEKLKSIVAKSVMIDKVKISGFNYAEGKDDKAYKVKDLIGELDKTGRNRLPVFNPNGSIRFILHRSVLDRFVVKKTMKSANAKPVDATIDALFKDKDDPDVKIYSQAFVVVGEEDSLAMAKRMMEGKTHALDVFVTKTGQANEPVTGWITNLIISENAKV